MVHLVGEAAVGACLGELLRSVVKGMKTVSSFKPLLQQLESTLVNIKPKVEEIVRLDPTMDFDKLIAELKKGDELICKCSQVQFWNCYHKHKYSKKIQKLDASLLRFLQMDLPLEMTLDVKQLLVDVKESNQKVDQVEAPRRRYGPCCLVPELPSRIIGLDVPLEQLKIQLFRDEVKVLGLCALGGCGKTTLASMLCQDTEVKGKFKENIFFLTVSRSPNLREILQRLFDQMDSGYQVPENDEDAVNHLRYLLKQREQEPMLLVLDDVWSESFLRKLVFRTVRYKMLVTSRTVFQIFDSTYELKMLSESDAITLFSHIASPRDADNEIPDEDLLNKIVKGCKGFPLGLEVIAHSLCRQPARKWRSTERMFSKGSSIFDAHKDLPKCLATSLGFLEDAVRESFLDLGCFPKDKMIPAGSLIDIWEELYELDDDKSYVNLLELRTQNLVKLVESTREDAGDLDGNFNELFVVQHDLLRDLAIHQSRVHQDIKNRKRLTMDGREESLPKSWQDQEHHAFNAQFVSIHNGEMVSSEWCKLHFPLAQVLMLNFSAKNCPLPQFMETMGKLKVLIIANHGPHHASLCGPPALGYHLPLLKRIRLETVSVPLINEMTAPFKNLQKISLVMCKVNRAFKNCKINISSMLPNLTEIDIDYCNDMMEFPQELCITSLQKLSITNCQNLSAISESVEQMTNLEVLRLHACTGLFELPNSVRKLHRLRFLDISDCRHLERMPEGMGELCGLRKLDMRRCSRVRELPRSTMKLRCLKEVICDEEISILWEPYKVHLPDLQIRVVKDSINYLDCLGVDFPSNSFYS